MTSPLISPGHTAAQSEDKLKGCSGYQLGVLVQAMILAFSRSNSSGVMTPRSRRSASYCPLGYE